MNPQCPQCLYIGNGFTGELLLCNTYYSKSNKLFKLVTHTDTDTHKMNKKYIKKKEKKWGWGWGELDVN